MSDIAKRSVEQMKKISYAKKLFFILQCILTIPLTIITLIVFLNQINLKTKNKEMKYETVMQSAEEQYEKFKDMIDYDMKFLNNYNTIYDVLMSKSDMSTMNSIDISNQIDQVVKSMSDNFSVIIYHNNPHIRLPKFFKNISELKSNNFYSELEKPGNSELLFKYQNSNSGYIRMFKKYISFEKEPAFIEISVSYASFIRTVFKENNDDIDIYVSIGNNLLSQHGVVSSLTPDEFLKKASKERNKNILKSEFDELSIYMLFDNSEIKDTQIKYTIYMLLVICLVLLLSYIVCKIFSLFLTRGLNKLIRFISINDSIDFKATLNELGDSYDEFDVVLMQMERYVNMLKNEMKERQKQLSEISRLEFQVLQEQISPHFLYNTLASIKYAYDDEVLDKIIDSMVNYYRIALSKGSNFIKISSEMNAAKEYLNIQKFSYDVDFDIYLNCEPELCDELILKSILQPIVENAFFYGINVKENTKGIIRINCKPDGEYIKLSVENNGPPFKTEIIEKIMSGEACSTNNFGGFGIKNILERLKIYYGSDCGIEIENKEYTCVTIKVKRIKEIADIKYKEKEDGV